MKIYTDDPACVQRLLKTEFRYISDDSSSFSPLVTHFFKADRVLCNRFSMDSVFTHLFVKGEVPFSQFDALLNAPQGFPGQGEALLCLAESGSQFHGFRKRKWVSMPGNLHLSVLWHPARKIPFANSAFLMVAVNSVLQTLEQIPPLRGKIGIKWVNDILLDGKKAGGVLAQTQVQGEIVERVVLGIGLNIDQSPVVTDDPLITETAALNDYLPSDKKVAVHDIFWNLVVNLGKNFQRILDDRVETLLNYYTANSIIIGKYIDVYSDPLSGEAKKVSEGKVVAITQNLELVLEDAVSRVRAGRIRLRTQ